MKTHEIIGSVLIGLVVGVILPHCVHGADPTFKSWRLVGTPGEDASHPPRMESRGTIKVDEFRADALGGFVRLTAKHPSYCPPGTGLPQQGELQCFRFSWRFDADVSRLSASRGPIALSFMIEGDRATSCMDQNPFMVLNMFGDPINYGDARSNERFYFRPDHPFHVGGPRTLRVVRDESWRKDASFKIIITDFRHDPPYAFQWEITYAYEGEAPGAPPPIAQGWEVDIDRPGSDYRSFDLPAADPSGCAAQCAQESQCRAWTYVKPGVQGPNARCWLKDRVPNPIRGATFAVSGIKAQ